MLLEILPNNYNVLPGVRAHGMYYGILLLLLSAVRGRRRSCLGPGRVPQRMTRNEFRPTQTPKGHQKTEAALELT